MVLRNAANSPTIEVPSPRADRASWTKIGVIAALGFVVGVAWPRLAGVRLGPAVPQAPSSASASARPNQNDPPMGSALASAAASVVSVAGAALSDVAEAASAVLPLPAPVHGAPVAVTPSAGVVVSCRTADRETLRGAECGSLPGLDGIVLPRLRKLTDCAAASSAQGKLRLLVRVDFDRGLSTELGRARNIASPEALLACAKNVLSGVSLAAVVHDKPHYSVAYAVAFSSSEGDRPTPADTPGPAAAATSSVDGDGVRTPAEVEWDVAVVRDAPKTGKVVARLQRGTLIRLGAAKDGWYSVRYGDGFSSEGWIHRGAIGR